MSVEVERKFVCDPEIHTKLKDIGGMVMCLLEANKLGYEYYLPSVRVRACARTCAYCNHVNQCQSHSIIQYQCVRAGVHCTSMPDQATSSLTLIVMSCSYLYWPTAVPGPVFWFSRLWPHLERLLAAVQGGMLGTEMSCGAQNAETQQPSRGTVFTLQRNHHCTWNTGRNSKSYGR